MKLHLITWACLLLAVIVSAQETTTKMADDTTTHRAEETTTKMEEPTTTKMEETTTKKEEQTTTKMEETTTKKEEPTTTKMEETTTKKEEPTTTKMEETTTKKEEPTTTKMEETTTKKEEPTTTKMEETTTKKEEPTTTKMEETTTKKEEPTTTKEEPTTTTKHEEPTTTTKMAETTTNPTTHMTTMAPWNPAVNEWVVKDENGTVCVVMQAALFNISAKCDGNDVMIGVMVNETEQSGSCSSEADVLKIYKKHEYYISLSFGMTGSNYHLANATVAVNHTLFKMCSDFIPAHVEGLTSDLRGPKTMVYRCNAQKSLMVNDNATLIMAGIRLQAFRMHGNNTDLSDSEYICMEDSTISNIVPIAVGCALAGLIVIVLIAYIVGRVRRRPYEPV